MKKQKAYEIAVGISILILLAGVGIPHFLGKQFLFPEDQPAYFPEVKYALECLFLFAWLAISILLILSAIKKSK